MIQNSQAFSCEILASLARSDGYLYRDNVGRSGGDVRLSSHEMACHDANGAEAAHVGEHVHSGLDDPLRALVRSDNQHCGSNPFGWLAPALIPVQHLHRMKTLP
ncbi:hypothetical protein [Brucella pseudogrignonensis]|uniref:hypothetical protein n=1 Tax=Brucella pseudogrignonensis TaxID=419475 RepID=UPI0012EEDE6F|nr:hypothetical protein [Brucella pseudogrignonensis]